MKSANTNPSVIQWLLLAQKGVKMHLRMHRNAVENYLACIKGSGSIVERKYFALNLIDRYKLFAKYNALARYYHEELCKYRN